MRLSKARRELNEWCMYPSEREEKEKVYSRTGSESRFLSLVDHCHDENENDDIFTPMIGTGSETYFAILIAELIYKASSLTKTNSDNIYTE